MIGSLRGKVHEVHAAYCLLEVQGVGHVVRATPHTLSELTAGEERFLYIHDVVREDARDLFGFLTRVDLELFERLLKVSGVGPKVALTILSAGSGETMRRAIMHGDLALMTSVPGVGKKTAQKIILELKGQLVEDESGAPGDAEVIEAMMSLGYSSQDARAALKTVSPSVTDVSERVREALKSLSK